MSDAYTVDGITVTPGAGGWYTLTGPGIEGDGERAQGKENADKRATEIAKASAPADAEAHIAPQGNLTGTATIAGDTRSPAEIVQEREAGLPEPVAPTPPTEPPVVPPAETVTDDAARADAAEAKNAALQATLDAMEERFAKLEKIAGSIQTVVTTAAPQDAIPASVPREYSGQMDAKAKKALAEIGVGVTTIVLEENESIPPTGLFISHNGRGYMIKPGEPVDVPDFLISVLDDAVMSAPIVDSTTQKVLGYRDRSKYPYRRVNADKG